MLRVTIDNKEMDRTEGETVLDAVKAAGVSLPTLCFDGRLKPYGGCRLCLVSIAGHPLPMTSCTTPLEDGMSIQTHTPELESVRKTLLQLLANDYPIDAITSTQEKEFHHWLLQYNIQPNPEGRSSSFGVDESNPYIRVNMSRCISCFRCVRICDELQGQFVWKVWNRGDKTLIRPDSGTSLRESSCVSCGACVDTCPTGALEDKSIIQYGQPTDWTRSTCSYCGTGCEINIGTRDDQIVTIRPVLDSPVSKGHLCSKGRYAYDFVDSTDRVLHPMIRKNQKWQQVTWDEANSAVAEGFRRVLDRHGSHSIGVLGSARATNEENYLAQKFARVVLGTNNVDCCARVCHAPSAAAMRDMLGTGAATNSFDDIEQANTIVICGCNPTENHPIVGARIKQAVLRGARLIVIDPRKTELASYPGLHLALHPGTNVPLLNAMANVIVMEKLYDPDFIHNRINNWDAYQQFIASWTPERAAGICKVEPDLIRQASRLYAQNAPSICFHGLGVTEHTQGTDGVKCLVNLALLTGNIGKMGTGINPLRGQNNVQGSAHMGCDPDYLTGSLSLSQHAEVFAHAWGTAVPQSKGLNLMQMMDSAVTGDFKALWTIGYDVLLTNPNSAFTRLALDALEFVVVQDMFINETAREVAHVFLPACSSFEKDGTFMNSERRVQRVRHALSPRGEARPDWEIICQIATVMGKQKFFDFHSTEDIWNEIRGVWKTGQGITYDRIQHAGLQWPCPDETHPGTAILHQDSFLNSSSTSLACIDFTNSSEVPSIRYPLLLVTGRTLHQFNSGTMTSRSGNKDLRFTDYLDVSQADAHSIGLIENDWVEVKSQYGKTVLPVHISTALQQGQVFATFHDNTRLVNRVTGPYRDADTDTPEYKLTAVNVRKVQGPQPPLR